ncbi:MAG: hypothetical protein COS34_11485 [Lysobacterales bacterium CG02_land_8_20_14_3_00_62_12]|nr:MAG: hypothetical protein COS34_11485 [Xanthomonadales bacterium CG02_land_8_20_14_3_00_62_12]
MSRRRYTGGFTLVELLLTTLLLALLMAGAFAGISTANKAVISGEALIDRTNRVRVAQEFLRRQLRNALALSYPVDSTNGETRMFEGDADTLRFVSTMPGYLSHGGAYVQSLSIKSGRGGRELLFAFQLLNGFGDEHANRHSEEADREPELLIENIRSGGFEYRGIDDTGKMSDWTEKWENPLQLPAAVRLKLTMDADSRYVWPDIEVAVLANASAAAASDPFLAPFRGAER